MEEIGDDQRHGRPSTPKTDANNEEVGEIIRQNRRLSIRAAAELVNTDKENVGQILHNNFDTKKVCSKVVPRFLTPEQKENRITFVLTFFKTLKRPKLLENVITCDES